MTRQPIQRNNMPEFIRIETHPSQSITVQGMRLLPFAKRLILKMPILNFSLVWNRPISVLVVGKDGKEQVLPVYDPTRQIVWTLYSGVVALVLLFGFSRFIRRDRNGRR